MNIEEYRIIKELLCKLIEHTYGMPDSKNSTEENPHINQFNEWEKEFAETILTLDECLKRTVV